MIDTVIVKDGRGRAVELCVVEYQRDAGRWRPHSIVTRHDTWDAYWSKAYGLLVHDSGSGYQKSHTVHRYAKPEGFPGRIWTAPGVVLTRYSRTSVSPEDWRNVPVNERRLRLMGYKRFEKLLGDPFEDCRNVEGHIEYCCICRDYLPDDNDAPCAHLRWSDDTYGCIGAGVGWDTDREATAAIQKAIPALCARLFEAHGLERVERLRLHLCGRHMRGTEAFTWDDELGEDHRTAESWLDTLRASRNADMRLAISHTIELVDAWLASKRAA